MNRIVPVFTIIWVILGVGLVVDAATIMCKFTTDEFERYTAVITGQTFEEGESAPKIYGRHLSGKKNSDVQVIDGAFRENKFQVFPSTLTQIFPNTEVLMLQDSGIKNLTYDSLKFTTNIKIMMFAKDNLNIEAGAFKGSISLEVLKFEAIDFSKADPGAFESTDDLQILSFKNCTFDSSNWKFLDEVTSVEELHILSSKLTEPPTKAVQQMSHLKILDLSGNELTYLHNDLVKDKNSLELLDLTNNKIKQIERTILEIWPNNAALKLEDNKCIDKNFGSLGTADLPFFDVVEYFMDCFHQTDDDSDEENEKDTDSDDSDEDVSEESDSDEGVKKKFKNSSSKSSSSARKDSVSDEKQKKSKSSSEEEEESDSVDNDSDEKDNSEEIERGIDTDNESVGTDSPFEFMKEDSEKEESSSEESEEESDEDTEIESTATTTEATTTTTTTEAETTTTEAGKKKKKKKGKKGKKGVQDDDEIEEEIPSDIIKEIEEEKLEKEEFEIAEVEESLLPIVPYFDEFTTTTEVPKITLSPQEEQGFLQPYEQASCRFYVNPDKEYHCVLENVTPDLRRINVDHLSGFDNEKVSGLFLRNSTLIKVPHIFFTTFPNLVHLSIEETNIKQLDDDTLKEGCGKLKSLILKKNKIRLVESESLKTCVSLQLIDLTDNPVERIEGGVFECNPQLNLILGDLKIAAARSRE